MEAHQARSAAIRETMSGIKTAVAGGVTRESLEAAKDKLLQLAARSDLFPRNDFPVPGETEVERTTRIYQETDGTFALYANSARKGQTYRPHNHGDSWAIIVAVEGRERQYRYKRTDDGAEAGKGRVEVTKTSIVEPGTGIVLLPGAIHSIEAFDPEPLLHLHCYGVAFENQAARQEFDMESGTVFFNNDIGVIEDMPLHREA